MKGGNAGMESRWQILGLWPNGKASPCRGEVCEFESRRSRLRNVMEKINDFQNLQHIKPEDFEIAYCRYFGMGHHLYLLVRNYDERIEKIGEQKIHPRLMAEQLREFVDDFKVVVVDSEMGSVSEFPNLCS